MSVWFADPLPVERQEYAALDPVATRECFVFFGEKLGKEWVNFYCKYTILTPYRQIFTMVSDGYESDLQESDSTPIVYTGIQIPG